MLKPTKPKPAVQGSIRLPEDVWPLFRSLLNWHGRAWFVNLIRREYKKLEKQHENE